jgi:hypothetical protein
MKYPPTCNLRFRSKSKAFLKRKRGNIGDVPKSKQNPKKKQRKNKEKRNTPNLQFQSSGRSPRLFLKKKEGKR